MTERAAALQRRDRRSAWGLLLTLAALVAIQVLAAQSSSGRIAQGFQNAMHGPWFALITWLLLHLLSRFFFVYSERLWLAGVGALVLLLAALTEISQLAVGRDGELADLVNDTLGAGAALALWGARLGTFRRRPAVISAVVLLLLALWPLWHALTVQAYRNAIAPDLVRFGEPLSATLFEANGPNDIVEAPAAWGDYVGRPVLRMRLADTAWPGVTFQEPIPDWQSHRALVVDAFVMGDRPLPLSISVRRRGADHAHRMFRLEPGGHRLELPFESLFDPARTKVPEVVVYSTRDHAGRIVLLGAVRLR